jgi:putative exosortase-associated protein (TIGR04073 family)
MRALLCAALLIFSTTALAEDYSSQVGSKLVRGLANAVTGFIEIPREIDVVTHKSGIIHGATWGLAKGVAFAVGRHLTGAFDIAFFFVPSNSITRPVYVWDRWGTETAFVAP